MHGVRGVCTNHVGIGVEVFGSDGINDIVTIQVTWRMVYGGVHQITVHINGVITQGNVFEQGAHGGWHLIFFKQGDHGVIPRMMDVEEGHHQSGIVRQAGGRRGPFAAAHNRYFDTYKTSDINVGASEVHGPR